MSTAAGKQAPAAAQDARPLTPPSQELEATSFDLWGSRLIEASAGTGKTWTIAALYLRLVLGHGGGHGFERPLRPAEILVMTFTRAATRELCSRIRERLMQAAQAFRGEIAVDREDLFLSSLISAYDSDAERTGAAWALANAAQSMDDAAIHTIDAWCQRMLKEHAFDSGNLFDEVLVADEETMRTEAAQDYWRQECYLLDAPALTQVLLVWGGVQELVQDMRDLQDQVFSQAAGLGSLGDALHFALKQRKTQLDQIKDGWAVRAQDMLDWLEEQTANKNNGWDGRVLKPSYYRTWLSTLKDWANGETEDDKPDLKKGWERFTPTGMQEARKADAPTLALPHQFHEFAELENAIDRVPQVAPVLRAHAVTRVAKRLLQLKRQAASFGFSDMLNRLNAALQSDKGPALRERILAQYPVMLVDEFQDTSPLQYQIFNQIYATAANDPHSALLLIGDPKQSIYGFRGADIYSYMQARQATSGRHYMLKTNFRSTQELVSVVNRCFGFAEKTRSQAAFMYRHEADNPLPFESVAVQGRSEELVNSQGCLPAMTLLHELEAHTAKDTRRSFAAHCAEQIVVWLGDAKAGFVQFNSADPSVPTFRPLRPADIAVLVRTGKEAAAVRRALARRSVASVYLSDKESVFEGQEARDVLHWLRAIAMPQDVRLVRAALASATIGLSLDEMGRLASQDEAFDARSEQLRKLRQVWQSQGVLAMLRQSLHQLGLAARWLQEPQGERKLTNFMHLAELLQSASSQIDGEQALIRWLMVEIDQQQAHNDEQIVRLESDADLVQVITIHKSKGLEYPLVCLPYATSFRAKEKSNSAYIRVANAEGQSELLLQYSEAELALADQDRLREDLRLLYVALTRARHALWLGFANVKVSNSDKSVTHCSAAGYLLGGPDPLDAAGWEDCLQQLAAPCASMLLRAAQQDTACTTLTRTENIAALQERPHYQATFERHWAIGSFSRLARDLSPSAPARELSPLQRPRSADDETDQASRAPAHEVNPQSTEVDPAPWHKFTRGAEAGNFLHEQLEWLSTEKFAIAGNQALAERLQRRCERAGRSAQAEVVLSWLSAIVQTRLPGPDAALFELNHALPEMEFWLPAQHLQTPAIDALCRQHLLPGLERPSLSGRELHGMLMGFADLVFEHQGKFWVLDYKSSHLGDQDADYDQNRLALAMAAHRYDVQAAIYLLALHRLLKLRLGDRYQPEQHLGGAVYLFLRGIKGPQQGVCLLPACIPLLEALDAMLPQATVPL